MKLFFYDAETDEEIEPEEYALAEVLDKFFYLSISEDGGSFWGMIDEEKNMMKLLNLFLLLLQNQKVIVLDKKIKFIKSFI